MKKIIIFLISVFFLFSFCTEIKANVLINEFSLYDGNDWVELHATENTDISGWILRDNAASIVETIPAGTTISGDGYYVIEAGTRLNADSDTIKLYKSDDSTRVDEIDYGGSGQVCAPGSGQSVGRFENGNTIERFSTPTKGATNVGASLAPCSTPIPSASPTNSPAPTNASTSTPTMTPTKTPTPSPKPTVIPSSTPDPNATPDGSEHTADILGLRNSLVPTDTPIGTSVSESKSNFPIIAGAFIFVGLGLMGLAGYMIWKKQKESSSVTISE